MTSEPVPLWRRPWPWLLAILAVAATLRFAFYGSSPPGFNQDEAANAFNAWCLLHTGQDMTGDRWPIFYSRMLGGNYTTLGFYLLMPFQAIGGMNVCTTRLPATLGGLGTVLLLYWVGRRMFNPLTGLIAAGLLAITPWHIHLSRWGIEANLSPLLALVPLAMMLWANLPLDDDENRRPRPWRALLAGLLTGVCCYGYGSVRLFVPVFLLVTGLATLPAWWRRLRTRIGALAIGGFVLGLAVTLGPLLWVHLTDPDIGKHARATSIWQYAQRTGEAPATLAALRYAGHFWPDFLFLNGDHSPEHWIPGRGVFEWYMLPLWLMGLAAVTPRLLRSRAARAALVAVLVYPAGDVLHGHLTPDKPVFQTMHALRSSPGIWGLVLLAAVGAAAAWQFLWPRRKAIALAVASCFGVAVLVLTTLFLVFFYGEYNRELNTYMVFHADLKEACDWIKPRVRDAAAIFCVSELQHAMNQPYINILVAMNCAPADWFACEHEVVTDEPLKWLGPGADGPGQPASRPSERRAAVFPNLVLHYRPGDEWDQHIRMGKWYFTYVFSSPPELVVRHLNRLEREAPAGPIYFICRPGIWPEPILRADRARFKMAHIIREPDGEEVLHIYQSVRGSS